MKRRIAIIKKSRQQVFNAYDISNEITHTGLCSLFVDEKPEVLATYLSDQIKELYINFDHFTMDIMII